MPEKTTHSSDATSPPASSGGEHHDDDGGPHGRGVAPQECAPIELRLDAIDADYKRLAARVAALATAVEIMGKDREQDDVCLEEIDDGVKMAMTILQAKEGESLVDVARRVSEKAEKYYVKARVYGAISAKYSAVVELAAADGYAACALKAKEALEWCYSDRNGVPMTSIEEMDRLLGAQDVLDKIRPLVDAVRASDRRMLSTPFLPIGMVPVEIARAAAARAVATGDAEADEHVTDVERACARTRLELADAVIAALESKP
jgi:hypothetical protein